MNRSTWGPRFWFAATAALALVRPGLQVAGPCAPDPARAAAGLRRDAQVRPDQQRERPVRDLLRPALDALRVAARGRHHRHLPGLRSPDRWFGVGLGLILGGGVSNNLIDRVSLGSVVDFIDMGIGKRRWYTFNLADAFAVAGVIMIIVHEFFGWGRRKPAATPDPDPATPPGSGQS